LDQLTGCEEGLSLRGKILDEGETEEAVVDVLLILILGALEEWLALISSDEPTKDVLSRESALPVDGEDHLVDHGIVSKDKDYRIDVLGQLSYSQSQILADVADRGVLPDCLMISTLNLWAAEDAP
jgi:hypothetical protein